MVGNIVQDGNPYPDSMDGRIGIKSVALPYSNVLPIKPLSLCCFSYLLDEPGAKYWCLRTSILQEVYFTRIPAILHKEIRCVPDVSSCLIVYSLETLPDVFGNMGLIAKLNYLQEWETSPDVPLDNIN